MTKKRHIKYNIEDLIRDDLKLNEKEFRIIQKLNIPDSYSEIISGDTKRGVVVDVESTGLNIDHDDIIQIALLPFEYEASSGKILRIFKEQAYESYNEPKVPITEEATLITGITNDMVKNKRIDYNHIEEIVQQTDLVIAHNAFFDRPMVEKYWDCFKNTAWTCTFSSINWLKEGFSSSKLEFLGFNFGWFYDGHTALNDCEACMALLTETLPISNQTVFEACRKNAKNKSYLIKALNAPYDKRQLLRRKGYKWRPADKFNGKIWWIELPSFEDEVLWLQNKVINNKSELPIKEITAFERYSERIWE